MPPLEVPPLEVPPHNLEAEMAVLGSILIDREMLDVVVAFVQPSDFYALVHETIFRAILVLAAKQMPVDKITLASSLRDNGKLDTCGGLPYLTSLLDTVPTAASAEYYASIVAEKASLRALIFAGTQFARLGFGGEANVAGALEEAESLFARTVDRATKRSGGAAIFSAIKENYLRLTEQSSGETSSDAQITPWPSLNKLMGPLTPGELCVIPAAPKMGKTGVLANIADFVATDYGQVAFFSLEMSSMAIAQRYAAMYSGVSARSQRQGDLSVRDLERISLAGSHFATRLIELYDSSTVTSLAEMRSELRQLAKRGEIRAVVVDGLNLLSDVDARRGDRSSMHDRLDVIYKSLVRIAKDFHTVVYAAQHVSRDGMNGPPTMQYIRGGGNPEGHAHAIFSPYRPNIMGEADEQRKGEFIVLASREGNTGTATGFEFIGYRSLWLDPLHKGRAWFDPAEVIDHGPDLFAEAMG